MAIFAPNQSRPYAIHPHRTVIQTPDSQEAFSHLLTQLKHRYGQYVHLSSRKGKQLQLVFHHSPDYLLGENIWEALGKPANLIYCEAIPEQKQTILVIVHNHHVYLDTKIPMKHLLEELRPLAETKRPYQVALHGHLPVSALQSMFHSQHPFSIENHSLIQSLTPVKQHAFSKQTIDYPWSWHTLFYQWQAFLSKLCMPLVTIKTASTP